MLDSMNDLCHRSTLLSSLQRALLGEVHPQLRQVSIDADPETRVVRLRFEYDGEPCETVLESGSCIATEVIADFPTPWRLDEQHVAVAYPNGLSALAHVAYRRWEPEHAA